MYTELKILRAYNHTGKKKLIFVFEIPIIGYNTL